MNALLAYRHLPAAIGYLSLTGSVLWPAVVHFRTRAMVDGGDAAMFEWVWWVMPRAIAEGQNPYRTEMIFHPVGADLALTTTAPLVSVVTLPVQLVLGTAAQVNAVQLASMFLAGMAAYLLAHRTCRHRGAAFVAGIGYALLPSRFVHVDNHLNLVETAVLPFGFLVFLWFTDAPSARRGAAVGACCGATFLIEPQLAVLLGIGLSMLGIARRDVVGRHLSSLLVGGGAAAVVAAPLLVPMLIAMTSGGLGQQDPTSSSLIYSSSPLSWVVPPLDRLWVGQFASVEPLTWTPEGIAYPGLAMLVLALIGVRRAWHDGRRVWIGIAAVSFVLSLGPYIFVRDTYLDVPLPFFALRLIPGLDAMRVPGRFALLGAVGIGVLAAIGLAGVARRRARAAPVLLAVAGLATLIELLPGSLPSRPHTVPSPYEAIAADGGEGAVLEVPLKWSTTQAAIGFEGHHEDFMFLIYARSHGRPLVSGAVSRYSDESLEDLLSIDLYRQVLALSGQPGFDEPPTFDQDDLAALGIGYVVYHRDDPAPQALDHLRSLDLPVLADDGTVIVWRVGQSR